MRKRRLLSGFHLKADVVLVLRWARPGRRNRRLSGCPAARRGGAKAKSNKHTDAGALIATQHGSIASSTRLIRHGVLAAALFALETLLAPPTNHLSKTCPPSFPDKNGFRQQITVLASRPLVTRALSSPWILQCSLTDIRGNQTTLDVLLETLPIWLWIKSPRKLREPHPTNLPQTPYNQNLASLLP